MSAKAKSSSDREKDPKKDPKKKESWKEFFTKEMFGEDDPDGEAHDPSAWETDEGAGERTVLEPTDITGGAEQVVEELKSQILRLSADFDNYRKRTQRDRQDWSQYASQSIVEKLLPVMDNLDVAGHAVQVASPEVKRVAEGFLMIHRQLTDILAQEGLTEVYALGEMFDPNLHEAVMTAEREKGQKDSQVVRVLRKGYRFKDKLLRPAMVQVAKD